MNAQERYRLWLENVSEEDELYADLKSIQDNDSEIEERFYQELTFGTAGLRGKLGAGMNRMNHFMVAKATQGIAEYILEVAADEKDKGVVIAHDPRHKSEEFSELTAAILAANGIKAYVFNDLRPTPQLAYSVRHLNCVAGINITASHNPKEYNGYKAYWRDGCQVSSTVADGMLAKIQSVDIFKDIPAYDFKKSVEEGKIIILDKKVDRDYLDLVESLAIHQGDDLDLSIPLIYTPLNGAGSIPFQTMMKDRGFTNWMIVHEQKDPDPDFTTVGYPNPESPAAFKMAEELGRIQNAELLMATDPDGDRFAIEIRDGEGNYVPLNGNQTGYILVNYILEGHKDAGTLPKKGAMVKSIVTSTMSTEIAKAYGVEMFETLTGFKNISGKVPYLHKHGYTYLFGYEESVGYAASEQIRDKDGISAGMLVAEAAAYYRKQGKTLWDVLQGLYETYGFYAEDEPNIVLDGKAGAERIQRMMVWIRANQPNKVAGFEVEKVIDYMHGYEDIPAQNMLRFYLKNDSWFAIRPSGTEPKIKFYFYTKQDSRQKALEVNRAIKEDILAQIQAVQ